MESLEARSGVSELKWFRVSIHSGVRPRPYAVIAVALASVLVFAGCSSDNGGGEEDEAPAEVPVADYVSDLCTALTDWRDSVQNAEAEFQEENALTGDLAPEEAQEKLGTYLEDVQSLTDDFVADLEAAGRPDVDGGAEVADQFVSGFEQFSAALGDLQGQVEELPTDSEAAFQAAGTQFLTQIQTSLQESLSSLGEINSEPINEAFTNSEACNEAPAG